MAQNIGTLISASIRPNDSLDLIASVYSNEALGGLHSYATLLDRDTIITARRQWGMMVNIYNDSPYNGNYQLTYGFVDTDINNNANWVKLNTTNNDTEWQNSVISISVNEPGLPTDGDRYLVGTSSSSIITGTSWGSYMGGIIATWNGNSGTWQITEPTESMTLRVDNDSLCLYKYEGTYSTGEWKRESITQVFYIEPSTLTGATYSATTSPTFVNYNTSLIMLAKFGATNSGTASINLNGIGYKEIKKNTPSGLLSLSAEDIKPGCIYSLAYDGTDFQITNPFSDAYNTQFYIPSDQTITVGENDIYWVYGDLTIAGTLINYGKVIVANGAVVIEGTGTLQLEGSGETILVDLFNTPIVNDTNTIDLQLNMTINGPSFSAYVKTMSLTASHLNTGSNGGATAGYILSADNNGEFKWIQEGTSIKKVYKALVSQSGASSTISLTSGVLTPGVTYQITSYNAGDDFTNVGATGNSSGNIFTAKGITPSSWTASSTLEYNPAVPVVYELENSIGNVYFQYDNQGDYSIIFPTNIDEEKTHYSITDNLGAFGTTKMYNPITGYSLKLVTYDSTLTGLDNLLSYTPITIEIYQ